jgi:putative nucleotidyltransferase with HDIG domain
MKKRLPRSALTPGMVLAEALRRGDGALLLPAATTLTEHHLELFPFWRITSAMVVLDDEAAAVAPPAAASTVPGELPEDLAAAAEAIRPRFAQADLNEPGMALLFDLALPRAARILIRRGPAALALPGPVSPQALPPYPDGPVPGPMSIIEAEPKLTSLPDVFVRINEVLNDANSTAKETAEALGMDTGLSTKLLKLVNSAFYGFPVKVDTLSRAVTIVGSRQLTTLALGISVISIFKDLPEGLIDMRSFWKHSIGCGIIASALAGVDAGVDMERLFVAGLLHDVGRLVLYRCLPRHAAHVLALARNEGILLRVAERRLLGFDHATLAGMLLRRWRFPESLEEAVRHHHGASYMGQTMPAMVHTADAVAGALGLGSSGEVFVPPLSPEAWTTLDLGPERLAEVVATADAQVEDIIKVFLPDED